MDKYELLGVTVGSGLVYLLTQDLIGTAEAFAGTVLILAAVRKRIVD